MKILFLCTAHNSLSQRLYLALSRVHHVAIEYALSDHAMLTAVELSRPDLIICPFLTTLVPKKVYDNYLTLIIHPGPPGDVGPSALDWVLMGDDGSVDDVKELLAKLDANDSAPGRTHWGVTVLQAIEEFDAGPVWAFEQFELDIDQVGLTKSELYRGHVTQAALKATLAAISRIQASAGRSDADRWGLPATKYPPNMSADPKFARDSVTSNEPFQGGKLHHRPLLKATQREFDVKRHSAQHVSRNIRCGDSQPGVLSKVFGSGLYVYGGLMEDNVDGRAPTHAGKLASPILGIRNQAVCVATCDGKGVWITHVRRPKTKSDNALWPKVTATFGLLELGLLTSNEVQAFNWPVPMDWKLSSARTLQEVWVDMQVDSEMKKTAYLYFNFYNGAMSTDQCSHLIEAMQYIIQESTMDSPVQAVVLMGGSYFSNGIALNVIEAATDPASESWNNINRIDDVVYHLLHEFPAREIITVAAIRGNAAAGGVALAAACDIVVAGSGVVLNPAYRAVGLYGSEYHTISYYGRCGKANGDKILTSMTPISTLHAQHIGLVDYIFPGTGAVLEDYVRTHVAYLLRPGIIRRGFWKKNVDLSTSALAFARTYELGEMSKDFWSARSSRYNTRRFDFVRKVKPTQTPLRFAKHRRMASPGLLDEEETPDFERVEYFQELSIAALRRRISDEIRPDLSKKDSSETLVGDGLSCSPPKGRPVPLRAVASESVKTAGDQTLFSCYYKAPTPEDLGVLTPPETPLGLLGNGSAVSPFAST